MQINKIIERLKKKLNNSLKRRKTSVSLKSLFINKELEKSKLIDNGFNDSSIIQLLEYTEGNAFGIPVYAMETTCQKSGIMTFNFILKFNLSTKDSELKKNGAAIISFNYNYSSSDFIEFKDTDIKSVILLKDDIVGLTPEQVKDFPAFIGHTVKTGDERNNSSIRGSFYTPEAETAWKASIALDLTYLLKQPLLRFNEMHQRIGIIKSFDKRIKVSKKTYGILASMWKEAF